jgi:hypothetical protein
MDSIDSGDPFELDCAKAEETHKRHTTPGAKRSRFICRPVIVVTG